MKKTIIVCSIVILASLPSMSALAVDCTFTPSVVKQGDYGGNEHLIFVCGYGGSEWNCFNLGAGDNAVAKNRQSLATAALLSDKQLRLRFYSESTCSTAMTNKTEPNATWLMR